MPEGERDMSLRTAAQQALEALEERYVGALRDKAMDALRTALAEPEQEPVACVTGAYAGHFTVVPTNPALVLTTGMALYTHPPQRKPLTDEEIDALPWTKNYESDVTLYEALRDFARAIERAHGIGGEA
jgi:hypothetical protein